jgi:hypothetical protein
VDDVGEDVGDLHYPIVTFGHVSRRLDDHRFPAQIEECRAIERVVVRRDDDTLGRRQVAGYAAALIDRGTGADAEHQARPLLHQFPHAGAAGDVDRRVRPVINDARERLDVLLVGEPRRHAGGARQVAMCGIECSCHIGNVGSVLRVSGSCHREPDGERSDGRCFHDFTFSTSGSSQALSNSASPQAPSALRGSQQ